MATDEDLAETLTASPSLDQDRPLESTSASSSSSPTSDPAPPPITKSLSSRKLNAKAPEFIPRSGNASSSSSSLAVASSPSPLPVTSPPSIAPGSAPPALPHVYQTSTRPAGPTLFAHLPVQGHFAAGAYHVPVHYNRQYYAGYVAANQQPEFVPAVVAPIPAMTAVDSDQGIGGGAASKHGVTDEVSQKILNQVEYYFSDLNLATTDHLIRFMNKDPEGNVPISVVASFKKIKALINSNSQLADILRRSEKLIVSEDGKKVKRLHRLTELDMEDLQARIVVAENLPEDHCHQTLMKIFSAVGSVKTIRTCQPQNSNGGASAASRAAKADGMLFSSKLHAFVEYESVELAEKAIAELNDENNWRNGLKVRLLLRPKKMEGSVLSLHGKQPKAKSSQARGKKAGHENESSCKVNDASSAEDSLQADAHSNELAVEDDKQGQQKKARNRGKGKGRGRHQHQPSNNRGSAMGSPPTSNMLVNNEQPNISKQSSVPRMPDGTRGFSMGRGKPVAIKIA